MKYCILLLLCCLLIPQAALSQDVYRSWFTDASATDFTNSGYDSVAIAAPGPPPSTITGTRGNGIDISGSSTWTLSSGSLSNKAQGAISFWIQPLEAGAAGSGTAKDHIILRGGDLTTAAGGFQISWDNSTDRGCLKFKMAGANGGALKVTTCQYDISSWAANDWHHVQVAWEPRSRTQCDYSKGLGIWVDRRCVASVIFGGDTFMSYNGTTVTLGGGSANDSKCYIDELIFRTHNNDGAEDFCYKDYFLTAPYTAIEITHMPFGDTDPYTIGKSPGAPLCVVSDNWVLKSKQKQYSIIGTRTLNASSGIKVKEYLLNFDDTPAYGQWCEHDAKPNITWTLTGAPSGTRIDSDGQVTAGSATGPFAITADFRSGTGSLTSSAYPTLVKDTTNKPDIAINYVEQLVSDGNAKWMRYSKDDTKCWPAEGDMVTTKVHIGNFGTAPSGSYHVKCEYAVDTDNDFRINGETWKQMGTIQSCSSLVNSATSEQTLTWTWTWPANGLTTGSYWIRVTVDCGSGGSGSVIDEICEANNVWAGKINAKAIMLGANSTKVSNDYDNQLVNVIGSFSFYDWFRAHLDRVNVMVRTTKCDTIPSIGIQNGMRLDAFVNFVDSDSERITWDSAGPYFDGGYPEPNNASSRLRINIVDTHEMGHTCLWLRDLYGCPYPACNVFPANKGSFSANFPPVTSWGNRSSDKPGMFSSHAMSYPDEFGIGQTTFMDSNTLRLDYMQAGFIHYVRQYRPQPDIMWGDFVPHGIGKNKIKFYNDDGDPLRNAQVYVYPEIIYGNTGDKYWPDQFKFAGLTDADGIFTFGNADGKCAANWDDYLKPGVESPVVYPAPFDRYRRSGWTLTLDSLTAIAPNCFDAELLLVKIVSGTDASPVVEYHMLPLIEFNNQFFKNSLGTTGYASGGIQSTLGTYHIRTRLQDAAYASVNDPAAAINNAPVPSLSIPSSVKVNTLFTLDGSASSDPEGQPMWYWFRADDDWNHQTYGQTKTCTHSFSKTGTHTVWLWVSDGLSGSLEMAEKTIEVTD